jgi:hypothetical protein
MLSNCIVGSIWGCSTLKKLNLWSTLFSVSIDLFSSAPPCVCNKTPMLSSIPRAGVESHSHSVSWFCSFRVLPSRPQWRSSRGQARNREYGVLSPQSQLPVEPVSRDEKSDIEETANTPVVSTNSISEQHRPSSKSRRVPKTVQTYTIDTSKPPVFCESSILDYGVQS